MADTQVVKDYADDLRSLLTKSPITEQRNFFKSFVERIDVDAVEVKVYYAISNCSWILTTALTTTCGGGRITQTGSDAIFYNASGL